MALDLQETQVFIKIFFSPISTTENFLTTFSCIETCNVLYISVKNKMHCQIPTLHKGPPPQKKSWSCTPQKMLVLPPPKKKCWSCPPQKIAGLAPPKNADLAPPLKNADLAPPPLKKCWS